MLKIYVFDMKQDSLGHHALSALVGLAALLCASCASHGEVSFTDEAWSVSPKNGDIINADSTLRFSLGDIVPRSGRTLISCRDSLDAYPGSEKYVARILKVCGLDGARVLFFSPVHNTLWAELPAGYTDVKPRAVSYALTEPKPGTQWIWNDDAHEGNRKPEQIYSNTFADKKSGALLVVDKLNYGDKPMACVHIYQSETAATAKMGFTPYYWTHKGNLLDHSCDDITAYWIDSRRTLLFRNYMLGRDVGLRRKVNAIREELKEILVLDQEPRNRIVAAWREHPGDTALHRSIAREILHNDSVNERRVLPILDQYGLVFGEENEVIWLIVQHGSLEMQKHYLPKFIEAAKQGRLIRECVAVMQDRVACREGRPQVYGSQGNCDERGVFVPVEIEDPEHVDQRRAEMGMGPLADYIKAMSEN